MIPYSLYHREKETTTAANTTGNPVVVSVAVRRSDRQACEGRKRRLKNAARGEARSYVRPVDTGPYICAKPLGFPGKPQETLPAAPAAAAPAAATAPVSAAGPKSVSAPSETTHVQSPP